MRVVCAVLPKRALRCHSPQEGGLQESIPCLLASSRAAWTPDHDPESQYTPAIKSSCKSGAMSKCALVELPAHSLRTGLHGNRKPQAVNPKHWLPSWMGQKRAHHFVLHVALASCCSRGLSKTDLDYRHQHLELSSHVVHLAVHALRPRLASLLVAEDCS